MKILVFILLSVLMFACNEKTHEGKFTVYGELKNLPDQQVYLEELFFNENDPQVLDTAELVKGKFTVSAVAKEPGLYRLRLQNGQAGYIFINDEPTINFRADLNDHTLAGPDFQTRSNRLFKDFIIDIDSRQKKMERLSGEADKLRSDAANDSLTAIKIRELNTEALAFKNFIVKTIDTVSHPVVAMFALGYTRGIDPAELKRSITGLEKRFPDHAGIKSIIAQYNKAMSKAAEPQQQAPNNKAVIGSVAPDISMPDTSGKIFSLSSLRGKYVLIDFWASWCAPCRGENPNVVANYNKYKNKNFTILGVSLDEDRTAWIKAINKDGLTWKQVSDLKGWSNAAVPLYGFEGIPFNVLLDPSGKIISTDLREEALGKKLAEVLR